MCHRLDAGALDGAGNVERAGFGVLRGIDIIPDQAGTAPKIIRLAVSQFQGHRGGQVRLDAFHRLDVDLRAAGHCIIHVHLAGDRDARILDIAFDGERARMRVILWLRGIPLGFEVLGLAVHQHRRHGVRQVRSDAGERRHRYGAGFLAVHYLDVERELFRRVTVGVLAGDIELPGLADLVFGDGVPCRVHGFVDAVRAMFRCRRKIRIPRHNASHGGHRIFV